MLGRLARRDDEPLADKERQRFVSRHEKNRRIGVFVQHLHHSLDSNKGLPTARRRKQHRNRRASHGLELLALVHRQPREPHHDSRVTLHERAAINVNIDAGAVDAELSEKRRLRGRRARRTFGVFRREESVVREQTPAAPTHGSIESQFPHRFAGELLRELRGVARQGLVDCSLEGALEEHGVAQPGEGRDIGDAQPNVRVDRAAGVVHVRHFAAGRQRFGQSLREQADATARAQNRLPAIRREAEHLLALEVQADDCSVQRLVAVFVDDAVDVVELMRVVLDDFDPS
mmetsp:Transcript_17920/g.53222  ORF Transcript_17920/g.53222 Transcript_17920/m.53222 type:complete len:288 (+) Transcript_17920:388-1251(+)